MLEMALALVAGLIVGSFLNVCIYRMPRDLSVVRPRSFCPSCEKTITWYDNGWGYASRVVELIGRLAAMDTPAGAGR